MENNILFTAKLTNYQAVAWYGYPVYKQSAKIKNYIKQNFGADFAAMLAEPHISDSDLKGLTEASWSSESISSKAVSFNNLPPDRQIHIQELLEQKIGTLKQYAEGLLLSEDSEENKWGQLINKSLIVPDKEHIFIEGDKILFVAWGFEYAASDSTRYDLKKEFIGHAKDKTIYEEIENKSDAPGIGITENIVEGQAELNSQASKEEEKELNEENQPDTENKNGEEFVNNNNKINNDQNFDKRNKWWVRFWWLWLLLLAFLILLFWLWRKNTDAPILPKYPGRIIPIDTNKIIRSKDDTIKFIVSDRINIWINGPNKSIDAFAKKFKETYPDTAYKILYYNTTNNIIRVQLQFPKDSRRKLKDDLRSKFKEFGIKFFDEYKFSTSDQPNDPAFKIENESWYQREVKALDAWNISRGNPNLVIAIIDDGFDLSHLEFKGKIYKPWNVPEYSKNVNTGRKLFHGTHVAGIAMGLADNSFGGAGIAPNCRFMPVQVGDQNGTMSTTSVVDGVLYAINHGANVINMSLGMTVPQNVVAMSQSRQRYIINNLFKDEEKFWDQIFKIAYEKNIVIVLAAGNQNILIGLDPMQRSAYTIKVSAVDQQEEKAGFSNYGSGSTISAPGVSIYSSVPGNRFRFLDGTSMAAPMVTGGVALIKSVNPAMSFSEIVNLLETTGIPVNSPGRKIGNIMQLDRALGVANLGRGKMPIVECGDVQYKIDSLLQEIAKLRMQCSVGNHQDTMRIPPHTKDFEFAEGRWKSTSDLHSVQTNKNVVIYFDFYHDGTGKITLVEPDNTQCSAQLSLSLKSGKFWVDQQASAVCSPPPKKYESYFFVCNPDANNCAECQAQNKNKKKLNNNFLFKLVRVN